MAQPKINQAPKRQSARPASVQRLPYTSTNYLIFSLGLAAIIVGYIFLSIGPWDSFWSLTLAPVFLFIGYLVAIPVAILYQQKANKPQNQKQ